MAQFDVYKNTNKATREQYPLLLDIQHSVLLTLASRILIPLSNKNLVHVVAMDVLMPDVLFGEQQYVLMTPQISAVSARLLSNPIGTLEHCGSQTHRFYNRRRRPRACDTHDSWIGNV